MASWPMISDTLKLRLKPWRPVLQNVHSSAQPTCEEMHKVPLSSSGMNTVSMLLAVSVPINHLRVPSLDTCSNCTLGKVISVSLANFSRNTLAMSVICSKSCTPKRCIQRINCLARKGFSPCSANHVANCG